MFKSPFRDASGQTPGKHFHSAGIQALATERVNLHPFCLGGLSAQDDQRVVRDGVDLTNSAEIR